MTTGSETPRSQKRGRPRADDGENYRAVSGKKAKLSSTAESSTALAKAQSEPSAVVTDPVLLRRRAAIARGRQNNRAINGHGKEPGSIPGAHPGQRGTGSLPKIDQAKKRGVRSSVGKTSSNIYEFPDSEDDEPSTGTNKKRGEQHVVSRQESSVQRKGGRPRRASSYEPNELSQNGTSIKRAESKKRSGRKSTELRASGNMSDNDQEASDREQTNGRSSPKTSTRRRKSTQKAIEARTEPRKPKGVLTPLKGTPVGRRRKSVAFDAGKENGQVEVYFEDLPSKPVKTPAVLPSTKSATVKPTADKTADVAADDEDEEVCVICAKPDSAPPNEIMFCDGCDMAVHQECYGISTIPEGDWLCRDCLRDDTITTDTVPNIKVGNQVPDIPNFEQHLRSTQRVLIDRCTGRRRIKLRGEDEAYGKAFQLLEQTVVAGEGNSMLVIGARGSGKTTLVESAVSALSREHRDEFHVVRLNGFIHTDDKLALKEIWRQLGKEMEVEDDLIKRTNNYADTLASLLALLSHPSEIAATQDGVTSKSVVFIIDEFDLFATHARQTLLYNLFDIAQAKKAPIAVLGLTTRIDVVESLEKRVKSRFSHRYVYLSLPRTLPAFREICQQALRIEEEDLDEEGIDITRDGLSKFSEWWAEELETLYKEHSFQGPLERHFYVTKSVSAFLAGCVLPLASLSLESTSMTYAFNSSRGNSVIDGPDSKLHLLESLSDLDLSMLVAAARLDIVADTDTVNFAMAYDEYSSFMGKQRVASASSGLLPLGSSARIWGRGVAGVAWERLVTLGLLVPAGMVGRGGAAGGGAAGLEAKMWKVDVSLEEIPASVKLNSILTRWCKEI